MFSSVSALLLVTQPLPATPAPPPAPSTAVQAVDPQRVALARTTMDRIFPQGSYGRMMTEMMGNSMGAAMGGMLDMTPEQMGVPETEENKAERRTTMREQILKDDPHFEERMRITTKIMGEEMGRVGTLMEPAMRQGLTHALARRFSTAQLTDINSFLATSSGQAFGHQFILVWTDPEFMKSMMGSMPEVMKQMPAVMAKVEAATAHLPKPKSAQKERDLPASFR